ncbi:MAG: hypothetical protein PHU25_20710 [Deltaproteobacteria bacterium]|nr:hypothetical protein [Deltaproteobacteria bacterium]
MTRAILATFTATLLGAGCFYDVDRSKIPDADASTDTGTGTDARDSGAGDGGAAGDVSGTLAIADGLSAASYASGTVYFSFLAACPTGLDTPAVYASFAIEDMDFTTAGASHPFAFTGVPAGTSSLFAFLDADGNADAEAPQPDTGDPVTYTSCAEVDVPAGGIASGVSLTLDFSMI